MDINLKEMLEKWPSSVVARSEIAKFTGGLTSPGYVANLDCIGKGPKGRFRVGRKVAYPAIEIVKWLEARAEALS